MFHTLLLGSTYLLFILISNYKHIYYQMGKGSPRTGHMILNYPSLLARTNEIGPSVIYMHVR